MAASWVCGELHGESVQGDGSGAATRGLPPALVELKAGLEAAHGGLPRENSGSRWPKITLGVLGDARRLLPDQLDRLNALCACACFGSIIALTGNPQGTAWRCAVHASVPRRAVCVPIAFFRADGTRVAWLGNARLMLPAQPAAVSEHDAEACGHGC